MSGEYPAKPGEGDVFAVIRSIAHFVTLVKKIGTAFLVARVACRFARILCLYSRLRPHVRNCFRYTHRLLPAC